jgi:hypothetical protein
MLKIALAGRAAGKCDLAGAASDLGRQATRSLPYLIEDVGSSSRTRASRRNEKYTHCGRFAEAIFDSPTTPTAKLCG